MIGLRAEAEKLLPPALASMGFAFDPRSSAMNNTRELRTAFPFGWFDRSSARGVERVEIQFDKRGGDRFVLNFGCVPLEGIRKPWGTFSFEQIDSVAGLDESYRLLENPRSGKWFGDSVFFFVGRADAGASVERALGCLPEIDCWSISNTIGPHMARIGFPVGLH